MALEMKEDLGNKIQKKERKERKIRIKAWEDDAWESILNARELIFWWKSSLHFLITNVKMCRSWFSLIFLWSQKAYLMLSLCHSQHIALDRRSDIGLPQHLSLWNLPSSYISSPPTPAWNSLMPLLHLQNRKKKKKKTSQEILDLPIPNTVPLLFPSLLSSLENLQSIHILPYSPSRGGPAVKNLSAVQKMQETWIWSPGWEDSSEEEMATHNSTFPWKIPWTEEPGRLQSMGSQQSDMT